MSVNSERDIGERIDDSDRVPSTSQVLTALVFGAGSRYTKETIEIVQDTVRRASAELAAERGRDGSPFAADAELHVINVSLHDVREPALRRTLLHVPTSFEILPAHARRLVAGGRSALRGSEQFQRLLRSLGIDGKAVDLAVSGADELQ